MDKRISIWDDIIFGHKVVVKQLSLLLEKFTLSDISSLKSQHLGITLQSLNMLQGGGTLRQKPKGDQSNKHWGSLVCHGAPPTCLGSL